MLIKKQDKQKDKKIPKLSSFLHKKEREYFLDQLATLIVTGMDLETALLSIKEEVRDKKAKEVLGYIIDEIQHGKPFSGTLITTNIITSHYGSLIELGEKTGRLKENIKLVSNQYLKQKTLKARVISALIYPAFVLGICFVVALTFAVYVLPQITTSFSRMNVEMNSLTQTMINLGAFFKSYGIIVIPSSILLFVLILLILFVFRRTKHWGQWIILKTPGFKQLIKETEMTNFTFILSGLLEAGIPINQIIDFLKKSTTWNVYNDFYSYAFVKLEQGFSFKKIIASYKNIDRIIPISLQYMIISSEQSGMMMKTMKKATKIFEARLENTSKNLATLIEPLILLIVWGAVLLVALSVIIPIYGMIGNVGDLSGGATVNQY